MTTDTSPAQSMGSRMMTFTPSQEEFKNFSRYIAYMESQGAHKAGMAKVRLICCYYDTVCCLIISSLMYNVWYRLYCLGLG